MLAGTHFRGRLVRMALDGLTLCLPGTLVRKAAGPIPLEMSARCLHVAMYFLAQWPWGSWTLYPEAGFSERGGAAILCVCVRVPYVYGCL